MVKYETVELRGLPSFQNTSTSHMKERPNSLLTSKWKILEMYSSWHEFYWNYIKVKVDSLYDLFVDNNPIL